MMTQRDKFDLEAAFDAARAAPPALPQSLADRIGADALTHQPARQVSLWRRCVAAVGGPAGLGGLVTATVAGFWFGAAPPAETVDPMVLLGAIEISSEETTELLDFGWYSEEG